MKKILAIALLFVSLSSYSQFFVKSAVGFAASTPGGIMSESDFGYHIKKRHNLSIGINYNPFVYKSFYNVKYGFDFANFVFYAGMGLVNRSIKTEDNYYVSAYGSYVVGFEYHTNEILKHANIFAGSDVIDNTLNVKVGLRCWYKN